MLDAFSHDEEATKKISNQSLTSLRQNKIAKTSIFTQPDKCVSKNVIGCIDRVWLKPL